MKRKPSKKKDKRSIIYISQPTFDEAKLNMQKTFVIKPEKQVESAREEEIDTKEEIINIKKEVDVEAEAEAKAKVIEKVKKEAINIKEKADVEAEAKAKVIEKVKKEAINIEEEADAKAEAKAKVIEKVKKEVINIKEEAEITQELQGEDNSPETEVIAAKENREFERAALNEGKDKEISSPRGVRKRKSFKDMNNEEKLYFLIQKPKYIPKVKCQIKTVKENLTGYVLSYEEGYVAIKMMEKTKEIKVKFEDIVHIKMMGL